MKDGDLGTWESARFMVVLEGVLCKPILPPRRGLRSRKFESDPDAWQWNRTAIMNMIHLSRSQNISIDVITFMGQDVGDAAADWLNKYDVPHASCEDVDFGWFVQSLVWRTDMDRIIDTDPERLVQYGIRAYSPGGEGWV